MNSAALERLRVVVLSNLYLDHTGGAEAVAHVGVEGLRTRGHAVSVVTLPEASDRTGYRRGRKSEPGVHRLTPNNLYHPRDAARWPAPLRALWHLRDLRARRNERHVAAILDEERPDAVVSHNLKGLGMRTVCAVRRAGVAHVHVLHDLQLCVPSGILVFGHEHTGDATPRVRAAYARRTRALFGTPALVVSPSRYVLDAHLQADFFLGSRVEVLPLPRAAVNEIEAPRGRARVLFAGQLAEHKGVRVLLAAWRRRTQRDAELHCAGDGTLRGEVEAAADTDPTITLHGKLPTARLGALYAAADIVVMPSLCYEAAGLVACEAQSYGAFVIASALGGLPEYVRQGAGTLVTPDDDDALARALDDAIAGVDTLRLRRPSIATAAPGLAPGAYCDRFETLLRELVCR